jgi:hypothetical protein
MRNVPSGLGEKVPGIVAGMIGGADCIDDLLVS